MWGHRLACVAPARGLTGTNGANSWHRLYGGGHAGSSSPALFPSALCHELGRGAVPCAASSATSLLPRLRSRFAFSMDFCAGREGTVRSHCSAGHCCCSKPSCAGLVVTWGLGAWLGPQQQRAACVNKIPAMWGHRLLADGAGKGKMKIHAVNFLFASVHFLSQGKAFPLAGSVPSACS